MFIYGYLYVYCLHYSRKYEILLTRVPVANIRTKIQSTVLQKSLAGNA